MKGMAIDFGDGASLAACTALLSWAMWMALDPRSIGLLRLGAERMRDGLRALMSHRGPATGKSSSRRGGGIGMEEVTEMVDIVRLGLTAGLSFDASLSLYCEGREGLLAEALEEALFRWRVGISTRAEALGDVARESGVRALEPFAAAVSQALELGAPLAETLEGQGREMRAAHRAQVEREIERVPVKLLIPTGTLILPALLLSIVGPLLAAADMV